LNAAKDTSIDDTAVTKQIDALIESSKSQELKSVYTYIYELAKREESMSFSSGFRCEPLQVYAAALTIISKNFATVTTVPSGSGKTFILLLIALYYNLKLGFKVLIVTTSFALQKQME